ncbi:MAG: FkbM family methyltransferase [Chitinophagales bacterium]|nr:FkbM family methyltransferase [Chitinophagales bacterium]
MLHNIRLIYYRLLTIMAYIKRWGLIGGPKTYLLVRKNTDPLIRVQLPDSSQQVFIRPNTSDVFSFEHVFAHECYKLNTDSKSTNYIIDCGANVGYSAVYFAAQNPAAIVVAIEPDSSNVEMILKNTSALKNVRVVHSAIWKNDAYLKITNKAASKWAFTVSETTESDPESFKAVGIKQLMEQFDIPQIDILKIDIEGAEYELLEAGYENWMSKTKTLIIELHERFKPGCEARFNAAISKFKHTRAVSGENEIVFFEP